MATKLISTLSVEFLIRDHLSFFKCFPHIYELPVSYSERMLLWGAVVIFLRYILISKTEFLTWIIEIFYVNKQNLYLNSIRNLIFFISDIWLYNIKNDFLRQQKSYYRYKKKYRFIGIKNSNWSSLYENYFFFNHKFDFLTLKYYFLI